MKKIILSTFFIFSSSISSQALDEAYLSSLPDEVRANLMTRMEGREAEDKPVYRRPSTMINKPDSDSVRFGSQIFNMMQSSFMPINEPNVDSNYVLDFGDSIEIQLIGQKNQVDTLTIGRDGSVNISDIGKVFLSGLSLESASNLIKSKLSTTYIGVQAFITLTSIRDIQVLIAGNAYNPGIYTLNGNSNLLHAIAMAGGVDEKGSFRQIDLIRNDKVIKSIDLYETFIEGKSDFNSRLKAGDSILVRPVKALVSVSGAVNRPSVYEIIKGESFQDVLNFANGFAPQADRSYIRIERLDNNKVTYKNVNEKILVSLEPLAGDTLYVKSFIYRSVTITGAVNSPGSYVIDENETLSSIIEKAKGYGYNAYPFGGVLINKKTLRINEMAKEKLYKSFVNTLITKGESLFTSESLPLILAELQNTTVSGRIMADFDLDVLASNPALDTSLEHEDEIFIPTMTQQVYIFGEINNPGAVRYIAGQSINEYLELTGGI